jgi:hypothetical protein
MLSSMRSTVRIDDDLLVQLKDRARRESVSLTRMLNRVLRAGLRAPTRAGRDKERPKQATFAMGVPRINVDKALAAAADFEDEEILRKIAARK